MNIAIVDAGVNLVAFAVAEMEELNRAVEYLLINTQRVNDFNRDYG